MDRSFELRQKLFVRLLGAALVSAGAGVYGCGSSVTLPAGSTGGAGGNGGNGGASSGTDISTSSGPFNNGCFLTMECFQWPQAGSGGTGG